MKCVLLDGATFTRAGLRANYGCTKTGVLTFSKPSSGWVIGVPERRHEPWIVFYSSERSSETVQVRVYEAWY
jgi:hypothetical protein